MTGYHDPDEVEKVSKTIWDAQMGYYGADIIAWPPEGEDAQESTRAAARAVIDSEWLEDRLDEAKDAYFDAGYRSGANTYGGNLI